MLKNSDPKIKIQTKRQEFKRNKTKIHQKLKKNERKEISQDGTKKTKKKGKTTTQKTKIIYKNVIFLKIKKSSKLASSNWNLRSVILRKNYLLKLTK